MLKLIALLGAMTALTSCSDERRFFPRQDFCCEERRFFPRRVFEERRTFAARSAGFDRSGVRPMITGRVRTVWLQLEWGLYQCRLRLQ